MRILILDDEKKSREVLKALIELYCENINAIETCQDIKEAMSKLHSFKPDLLFMDISLREGDSFHLLDTLEQFDFEVVFITAFDENSIRVLNYCGIPCLMKPIEVEQLAEGVETARRRLKTGYSSDHYALAKCLLAQPIETVPVFHQNKWELVSLSEIESFSEQRGQTLLTLANKREILSPVSLNVFEQLLGRMF